jgi:hypothetical protein
VELSFNSFPGECLVEVASEGIELALPTPRHTHLRKSRASGLRERVTSEFRPDALIFTFFKGLDLSQFY